MAFIYYPRGGGASTDPGISHVESGVAYEINGVSLTGTLSVAHPTATEIADAIWGANTADYTATGTFGLFVQKLLTLAKFIGLS